MCPNVEAASIRATRPALGGMALMALDLGCATTFRLAGAHGSQVNQDLPITPFSSMFS